MRPTWDAYGLALADVVAQRADCVRRRVGAIIMDSTNRIVSAGYNGSPVRRPGCLTDGACPRAQSTVPAGSDYETGAGACIAIHAEPNAIIRASWHDMVDGTIFITDEPCSACLKLITGTPLARAVWPTGIWIRTP